MTGTWVSCPPPPNTPAGTFYPDTMLLLTDGTVLIHNADGPLGLPPANEWLRYAPDEHGNYATGTWNAVSPMATARQFFSSGVLRDGRAFVIGGEDSSAGSDTPLGEIFDPLNNTWAPLNKPPGFDFIAGDASGCILADGRVLLGAVSINPALQNQTAIWDPSDDSWVIAGTRFGTVAQTKSTNCNEETWTLLPDGSVLSVETFWTAAAPNAAQKYLPEFDEWVSAGATPQSLALQVLNGVDVYEIGPAILLPNGVLFAVGATGQTALYVPPLVNATQEGTWFAGPQFPPDTSASPVLPLLSSIDAPACLEPNGKVLCVGGTTTLVVPPDYFSASSTVFEYDPSNPLPTLAPLAVQPPGSTNPWTWEQRFLLVPSGDILYSAGQSGDNLIYLYRPDGGPNRDWKPQITETPERMEPGRSYRLYGRQLNGLSQAVSYGDDAQMATNYPIVRLREWGGTRIAYCRSFDHSTMAVATGSEIHHTHFRVPPGLKFGRYELVVIANGIPSDPMPVDVERDAGYHSYHHDHDHRYDDEVVEFNRRETKYKDKDSKEAKEKEKDAKEAKEKDSKEYEHKGCKEKEHKEFEHKVCKEKEHKEYEHKGCKEKEHKEYEHKGCKEKEHKEFEHKGCKEKEQPEHFQHIPNVHSVGYGEVLHRLAQISERLDRLEHEGRRHFITEEERPPVGEHALRAQAAERSHGEGEDRFRRDERPQEEERRAREPARGRATSKGPSANATTTRPTPNRPRR